MFSMLVFMCRDPGDTTSKFHVVLSLLSVLKIANIEFALRSLIENELDPKTKIQSILKVPLSS